MTRRLLFFLSLVAFAAPIVSQTAQQQPQGFGTIHGTVVRDGTTEPIPDIQVAVTGRAGMTAQEAQTLLNAISRGGAIATNIPAEVLQNAQEAARGGGQSLAAVSAGDGQFTITNVPAGQQTLRAQLEGYFAPKVNGNYPPNATVPVTVTAGQTTNIKVSMLPGGTITGRVSDPAGKPLSEAAVQVLRQSYQNGVLGFEPVNLNQTDDRGEYRLYRLPPGDYYVAASPRPRVLQGLRGSPGVNAKEVQVPTFYPGVDNPGAATKVTLRSGDDQGGINIQMRTSISVKVAGTVTSTVAPGVTTGPRGQARPNSVLLVPAGSNGMLNLEGADVVQLNADGGPFEFQNVAPGSYEVIARVSAARGGGWGPQAPPATATGPWAFGRVSIDTRTGNAENLAIIVRTGVDLKGRVLLDGKPTRANVRITIQPDAATQNTGDQQTGSTFNQIRQYAAPIADDGTFTIPLLPEGRYRFQVAVNPPAVVAGARGAVNTTPEPAAPALPAGTYLSDIRQGGASVYDNGLVVGSGEVNPVEVLLSTQAGSLEGTAMGADQKPVTTPMTVVLIPPDNRRQNPALYRTARSNDQGRFTFANIPPGRYSLYAWDSVPAGAYQSAEFMEQYAGRGVTVMIQAGSRTSASVGAILEK